MKIKSSTTHEGALKMSTPSLETTDNTVVNAQFIQQKSFASTALNNTWTGTQTFSGPASFNGLITFNGDASFVGAFDFSGILNASNLNINSHHVTVNAGELGSSITNLTGGLLIDRGTGLDAKCEFDETDGKWHFKLGTSSADLVLDELTATSVYLTQNPTHPNHAVTKHYIDDIYNPGAASVIPIVGAMLIDSNSINFTYNMAGETETADVKFDATQMAVSSARGLHLTTSFLNTLVADTTAMQTAIDLNASNINDIKSQGISSFGLSIETFDEAETPVVMGVARSIFDSWNSTTTYQIGSEVLHSTSAFRCKQMAGNIEPEVHPSWAAYWDLLPNKKIAELNMEVGSFNVINHLGLAPSMIQPFVEDLNDNVKIDGNHILDSSMDGSEFKNSSLLNAGSLKVDFSNESMTSAGIAGIEADDYIKIQDGVLSKGVWNGATHETKNVLFTVNSGTAVNGDLVFAGKFDHEPTIILSPKNIQTFSPTFVAQSQNLKLDSYGLIQNPLNSGNYYFNVLAALELGSGSTMTVLNSLIEGEYNSTLRRTTTNILPGPNSRRVQCNVKVNAHRYWTTTELIDAGTPYWLYSQHRVGTINLRVHLRYKVAGIWYSNFVDKALNTGVGTCTKVPSSFEDQHIYLAQLPEDQSISLDTGVQASDIQEWYVESVYSSSANESVACESTNDVNDFAESAFVVSSFHKLMLEDYSTTMVGATTIATGTVGWMAI